MDIMQSPRTTPSSEVRRSTEVERDEARAANRGGYSFLLVHGSTWLCVAVSTFILSTKTAALLFMFQGLVAFPAALLLERALGYRTLPKHNTLQPLFIQVASMQLLALPAVIVVFNLEPIYTPVAFAAVGGAHFLPYSWLQRTPVYGVLAVTVAIGPWALLVAGVTPGAVFHLTGFLVGAAMLAAALAIWRSTAPSAKGEEREGPPPITTPPG